MNQWQELFLRVSPPPFLLSQSHVSPPPFLLSQSHFYSLGELPVG